MVPKFSFAALISGIVRQKPKPNFWSIDLAASEVTRRPETLNLGTNRCVSSVVMADTLVSLTKS